LRRITIPLLEARRYWILDAGCWIYREILSLLHLASRDQHPASHGN
jgi:hypothetical protein